MRSLGLRLLLLALALGAGPSIALADPVYDANSVVESLLTNASLGAERGICVGTEQECAAKGAPKPAGFDMMVNFALNSDQLTEQTKVNLDEFARALKDDRLAGAHFLVEGYTDATGSDTFNEALSWRRAQAVVTYLSAAGVPDDRMTPVGRGESDPREGNAFDPLNRRVETRVEIR